MNEQIEKLINQAWELTEKEVSDEDWHTYVHERVVQIKFAELIVEKCIDIMHKVPNGYRDYRDQIEDGMRQACIDDVKNYFGVK